MENTITVPSFEIPVALSLGTVIAIVVLVAMSTVYLTLPEHEGKEGPVSRLQTRLGMETLHVVPFLVTIVLWTGIAYVLVTGLFGLIFEVLTASGTGTNDLFIVFRIAGLTTVLGATIALPLTMIRLRLTQRQTETATKTLNIANESLFNEKINAATEGLYARRQVTKGSRKKGYNDVWEDDVVQRNVAITKLEKLALKNDEYADKFVLEMATYVNGVSAGCRPKEIPTDCDVQRIHMWGNSLRLVDGIERIDLQTAIVAISNVQAELKHRTPKSLLNLSSVNLQAVTLQDGDLSSCNLSGAVAHGADFCGTNFHKSDLYDVQFSGAILHGTKMDDAFLRSAKFQGALFHKASFRNCDCINAHFELASLIKSDFTGAILNKTYFDQADMLSAKLNFSELKSSNVAEANLSLASFIGANIWHMNFEKTYGMDTCSFRGAGIKNTTLRSKDFDLARISEAFGDATVGLPNSIVPGDEGWPPHWSKEKLEREEFLKQWRAWQATLPAGWDT